jgi:hypothetical protein
MNPFINKNLSVFKKKSNHSNKKALQPLSSLVNILLFKMVAIIFVLFASPFKHVEDTTIDRRKQLYKKFVSTYNNEEKRWYLPEQIFELGGRRIQISSRLQDLQSSLEEFSMKQL